AIKPNPHPYAIKTTSTGALSRSSNASPHYRIDQHHYVPPSPSSSPSPTRGSGGHRYSQSLTDVSGTPGPESVAATVGKHPPRPLPFPPNL
ncbi:hypothetical protein FA15DRAFT_552646, partial [Coprinopsis marcescibilis]